MIRRIVEIIKMIRYFGVKKIFETKKASDFAQSFLRGFVASHVIFTLLNVGLLDECNKRDINLRLFARRHKLNESVLYSLCDYLYSLKILKKKRGVYSLDSKGYTIVNRARGFFDVWYAYQPVLYNLESILRGEKKYGKEIIRRGKYVAKGSGEIGNLLVFPFVAKIIQKYKFRKVLDLGCGDCSFLVYSCKNNPNLLGYGIDISEEAILYAKSRIKKEKLEKRIKIYKGDIFDIDKIMEGLDIDVITSFFTLHEFLFDKKIIRLFKKFKRFFKGKYLILCEYLRQSEEDLRKKPTLQSEYQMIHPLTSQGLASREEWEKLFWEAGFTIVKEECFESLGLCIFFLRI